jgi:hypothetical protein
MGQAFVRPQQVPDLFALPSNIGEIRVETKKRLNFPFENISMSRLKLLA